MSQAYVDSICGIVILSSLSAGLFDESFFTSRILIRKLRKRVDQMIRYSRRFSATASGPSRIQAAFLHWRSAVFICVSTVGFCSVVFCSIVGCGQPGHSKVETPPLSTPEADLEWVMKRLQRALDISQSAAQTGLSIKRNMSYEYLAPDSSSTVHTAVVKVNTTTIFRHNIVTLKKQKAPLDTNEDQGVNLNDPLTNLLDPLADSGDEFTNNFTNVGPEDKVIKKFLKGKPTVDAHVPPRRLKELKTFNLVYLKGKWQLEKPTESELEQSWFQYTLEN